MRSNTKHTKKSGMENFVNVLFISQMQAGVAALTKKSEIK